MKYQIFYNEKGRVHKTEVQATGKEMAKKFFTAIRPKCQIVHISKGESLTAEYISNLLKANLL